MATGYKPSGKLGRKAAIPAEEGKNYKKQPEGPPSQNRKYNTKGSEYRPGMRLKPKGIEVPAVEESLMDTDDLG